MPSSSLEAGFALDRLYRWMEGQMDGSKRPTLALLARLLAEAGTPYALIGGVALQIHRREPRTTLDIDLAVATRGDWPAESITNAGFRHSGSFAHTENWMAPDGTPVQVTDDPALSAAVGRAETILIDGESLRVLAPLDLLRAKLRAAADPARRRSKRLLDLADAQGLVEDHPELEAALADDERDRLSRWPS